MKNYLLPVLIVTGYLLVYTTAIQLNLYLPLLLVMFSISPLLIFWMVFKVLTAEVHVEQTFDEKWYEDGVKRQH